MTINPTATVQLAGRFKFEAVNEETGERRLLADWFDNLILDQGLNRLGQTPPGILSWMHVGTGSAAPTASDTQLQSLLATSNNSQGGSGSYVAGPPAYVRSTQTIRFNAGTATGNLSEVGVGWSGTASHLFSRALIKDGGGTPTTITVLPSEALDVTYELRVYPPADVTGSITISGTTYAYTIRPQQINSSSFWVASAWSSYGPSAGYTTGSHTWAYNGAIGSATGSPSGSSYGSGASIVASGSYSNNSYQRSVTMTFGLNDANLAGGIRCVSVPCYGSSTWQIEFIPSIAKVNTNVLTLNFMLSWARRP